MAAEWPLARLEECLAVLIDYRGKSPPKSPDGIPVLSAKVIKDGRITEPIEQRISAANYELWMRRGFPKKGDIVLTTEGPLGEVAQLDESTYALGQRIVTLRGKDGVLDNAFLKFLLKSDGLQHKLKALATGTTVEGISQKALRSVELPLPAFSEQRAIAHILGTLDDKIELNRRMNETLEAMARALFKSWFVDFDPVGGKMPADWTVGKLSDVVNQAREQINPLTRPDEIFDHYSIPAFDDGQRPKTEKGEQIKSQKFVVSEGAVLLSKLNPEIDRTWLVDVQNQEQAVCSTEFLVLKPRKPFGREFVYCLLRSKEFRQSLQALVTGTSKSHQRAQPAAIFGLDAIVPAAPLVSKFGALVGPMFEKCMASQREAFTLAALRDTLLPKLISGEVRVKGAERQVEALL